jgi:two-component system phosphate regulon sensor histidine kinase PhoR
VEVLGKVSSILIAVFFAVLTAGGLLAIAQIEALAGASALAKVGIVAGVVAVAGAAFLLPFACVFDSTLKRLAAFVTSVSAGDVHHVGAPATPVMGRLARGVAEALQAVQKREEELRESCRDLQVRHRILKTEHEQLGGVLDALRDAVVVSDAFDEVIMLNDRAAEIFEFDYDQSVRRPVEKLIADQRVCQLIREVREAAQIGEVRTVEHDISTGGAAVGYQITLTTLPSNAGKVGAVVCILHDLTREREVAQMKSDFVSKASHELRTPLSSIRAYIEMLVDGEAQDEESRREFYGIINDETERLSRMIDNMLNISRIEAGIVQIDRELVDMSAVIRRAVESLSHQALEKRIMLGFKGAPVDLSAEGDADMLYQVVLNLVSNAIKYTPEGGRVTVTADSDNLTRSVVVSVNDTGLGIPPDALPRLFEKFFRIENFKRVAKGTGLGLNLCKHIVETVHHGQIGVESKLGMGSRFWFSIPMRFAGAQAA